MRPHGTPNELARRRQRAVQAYREGQSALAIAKVLGVDRCTVHRWIQRAQQPGGLDPIPIRRPPRLSDDQLRQLEQLLLEGATQHGWATELWTASRVAVLIQRHFNISYHAEHVRKILKRRLRWTSQKPQKRAKERDEEAIRYWCTYEFPLQLAAAQWREAHLVFLDESCYRLTPTVRRTLAPRGKTPIIPCWDRRDKISAISAITLSPKQLHPGLFFELLPDKENFHGEEVVRFLKQLRRHLPRITLFWDRSRIHSRSKVVQAYLEEHPEIEVVDFPGYAPELNPDEMVWSWTKYGRLCNYAAPDLVALRERVETELEYLVWHPYELWGFIQNTPLPLIEET
jgi:transposase